MNDDVSELDVGKPLWDPEAGWQFVSLIAGSLLIGFLSTCCCQKASHDQMAGPAIVKGDAKQFPQTVVSPHDEAPIRPGKNVLWCSTFQLVWNEACRYAGGGIHMEREPAVVPILNKKNASQDDVDRASCLVLSGLVEQGIIGKIREELARKFEGQASPDLLNSIELSRPDGYLAYAYLFRALPFRYPLKRQDEPLTFGTAKVASFGLRNVTGRVDEMTRAEQIKVLDYKNGDDFIVALQPEDKNERIVLAKIAPADTLPKTVAAARSRIAASDPGSGPDRWKREWQREFHIGESLVVPLLDFELWKQYDELCGKTITTPGPLHGMPIVAALQAIRFRLDEHGAILKSEATMVKGMAESEPRQLIFDKPFLILLERRDARRPYFALWVDNTELLTPWK